MSEDQYLAFEAAQTERTHEWVDGTVIERDVATEQHEDLVLTLAAMLRSAARRVGGKGYPSNLRVRTGLGTRRYPDAIAVAGPRRFAPHPDDQRLDLLNPTVVVEVLSDSTEDDDEGNKLVEYAATDSVRDYLIADPRRMRVVHRTRPDAAAAWAVRTLTDPADVLEIASIGLRATLGEVYEGVAVGG